MKAMRHDRNERYQTVKEMANDIQRFMEGRDVSARRDSAWEATRKLIRRNPRVFMTAATAVGLLLLTTTVFLLGLKSERYLAVRGWHEANKARAKAADAERDQFETALAASEQLARKAIRAQEQGRREEADLRADAAVTLMREGP